MSNREKALLLLHEYVLADSLRRHCLAVAYAMEAYADKYGGNKEQWWSCGLLHDFDYEKYPSPDKHPFEGVKILKEKGYSEEIIQAILGHAEYSGVPRISMMAKCLFAVDELCGLIIALAHVRPGKFEGMDSDSVKKAMKKKGFAEAIHREDIEKGINELGIPKEEHFTTVIEALRKHANELGF